MAVSPRVHDELLNLGTNEHILAVARRVHPTWIAAHGHIGDRGVADLAREIGQCVAAFHHLQDRGEDWTKRYVIGPGFVVVRGPGIQGFSVAVLAGEVFDIRLEDGQP